jgi:hypothetical protein
VDCLLLRWLLIDAFRGLAVASNESLALSYQKLIIASISHAFKVFILNRYQSLSPSSALVIGAG